MRSRLLACSSCGRHVFASEPKCPFCDALVSPRGLVSAVTLGAGLSLLGCHKDAKPAEPATTASASASAPAASASAETANADAGLGLAGLIGHSDFIEGPDGGLIPNRGQGTVYGPAQSVTNTGVPRGDVTLGASSATVPVDSADRVLAGLRPRLRMAYNKGLQSDPTQSGKLTYTITIAANGDVTNVDLTGSGLSADVVTTMKSVFSHAVFNAPGKESKLSGTITCTPQK